jgi:hypothetical protein
MFDFVLARDCRKRRVTDTFHCDAIRDCSFILILRSLAKSSFYHILGQTSECAILRLDGAFVLFSIGLSFERLSYERPLDNLRDCGPTGNTGDVLEAAWELGVNARGPYVL